MIKVLLADDHALVRAGIRSLLNAMNEVEVVAEASSGEEAIEPIRMYCRKSESLSWALKALAKIVPAERLADELLALLDQFDTEYIRNPEPKVQLLRELSHHPTEDVRIAVEPFLNDASEPVRFTAATALLELNMRLGEGTGAALAAGIVKAAARLHSGMATFAQAGVSEKGS